MSVRGLRGAITVNENSVDAILAATRELLLALIQANHVDAVEVASAWFTTTPDLNAVYPARAARELGWTETALMCSHEMNVPEGLPMCVRVLIHWNTDKRQDEMKHIYLGQAVVLRTDRK